MEMNKTFVADTETVQNLITEAVNKALEEKIPDIKNAVKADEVYTSSEVCDILKISKGTLKNWRDQGKITFFQDGGVIRYKREHLLECMKEQQININ